MTKSEIAAFDAGVLTVLELARRTAESLKPQLAARPTRIGFAVAALEGLAEEGLSLLKGDRGEYLTAPANGPKPLPSPQTGSAHGLVIPALAGDDRNFGLTDEEIMRPSRETIIGWLSGRTPMLASHWSRIAAALLLFPAVAHAQMTLTGAGPAGSQCTPISPPSNGIYDSPSLTGSASGGGTFTASNAASPDCTKDASTFVEDTSSGNHTVTVGNAEIAHAFTAASATFTIYAKQGVGTRNVLATIFSSNFASQANVIANLATCTEAQAPFTNFSGAIASAAYTAASGFCKVSLTVTLITDTGVWLQLANSSDTTTAYTGDGTSSLIYWGAGLTSP